jgi:hypothetical protein
MITDKQLDETLVELLRTKRALEALRTARKRWTGKATSWQYSDQIKEHASALRASLDLTRALAKLRKGDV